MSEQESRPPGSDPDGEQGDRSAQGGVGPHRGRRLAIIAGVVVVVVLGAGLAFALTRHSRSVRVATTPPTSKPSTTGTSSSSATTSTSAAPPLARGAQASRSAIPWSQVGPGWMLATWGPAPGLAPGEQPPAGSPTRDNETTTLFLVNPIGGRYLVATLAPPASGQVVDWSPDR
jgi:hypothetical protein